MYQNMDLSSIRKEYRQRQLRKADLLHDPFEQFRLWLQEAIRAEEIEPNGMALATGSLSCRHVLLKAIDKGFVFFTNLNSRKAGQLEQNPAAAAAFWWRQLERQVTLEGYCEKVSPDIAAAYFSSRPRESRLAAWSSEKQSSPLTSRDALEERYQLYQNEFKNKEITLPPFWGGFRLIPHRIEFWQGRPNRLHDRFVYLKAEGGWTLERLYP
ncbi:MAG: pyridoxamine 5'-phosphate oxidase [Parachlamydia sp.]|nr:pyridoxamine 5'-phosphate oxidase [Parachlamydia sp.]